MTPRTSPARVGAVVALTFVAVLLAACGGGGQSAPPITAPAGPAVLGTRSVSALGAVLVDGQGHTLYVNVQQKDDPSACDRNCLSVWPPVLTSSTVDPRDGLSPALLGTVTLPGVGQEVTYNHYPLHSYVGDSLPGDANGQAIQNAWYAITASGSPASPAG
jgi:predicted lipoprotein with Yx(FWY)xxD motif